MTTFPQGPCYDGLVTYEEALHAAYQQFDAARDERATAPTPNVKGEHWWRQVTSTWTPRRQALTLAFAECARCGAGAGPVVMPLRDGGTAAELAADAETLRVSIEAHQAGTWRCRGSIMRALWVLRGRPHP